MSGQPHILFITLDQFRADSLSCAGHPVVRTPVLDALAADGVRFARHYSQSAPCAPGRAALYTGTYQMNNRVVANGTPLDDRFDNVARAARRAGYEPAMFGYTDVGVDPRLVDDPSDPRLSTYEGVLPGFDLALNLDESLGPWMDWLRGLGHALHDPMVALATEDERPAEHSVSTFFTDRLIEWIDARQGPWFAHASYYRPHPPYSAAGHFAAMYPPARCPQPLPVPDDPHPLHRGMLAFPASAAPSDHGAVMMLRSQYYGMITEVDAQLGRLFDHLQARGAWEETVILVTSDHGEQLGDQGLVQKGGFFESSYHIPGIVRDPRLPARGAVVDDFTENVDVMPTLCEAMGLPVPAQCDGYPLTPYLRGEPPPIRRDAAFYEWDWRDVFIPRGDHPWPWDRRLERQNLAVRRTTERAYVQFGDGSWRCFDLAADPTWRTEIDDPAVVLEEAQAMLVWRQGNLDRQLTGFLLQDGGIGRRPDPDPR